MACLLFVVMHLSIVEVLLHVLDDDPLAVELVVDPLDEDADEVLQPRVVVAPGLDHGPLLVLLQQVLLGRNLSGLGHA